VNDWIIEGPRKFEKDSVINQNNYTKKLEKVVINTEETILLGREQDRKKLSMAEIDYNEKIDGNPLNSNKNG
jgi:NADH-quinone oxidoreductase subunit G